MEHEESSFKNPTAHELVNEAVSVSIEEVGVKRQTEMRPKNEGIQQAKRVENTVLHIHARRRLRLFGSSKNTRRQRKREEAMPEGQFFLSNFCQNMLCNDMFYDTIGSKRRLDNVFTTKPQ